MRKGKPDRADKTSKKSAKSPTRGTQGGARQTTETDTLFGTHAVRAALANPARRHKSLMATTNAANALADVLQHCDIVPEICAAGDIARKLPADVVHQGVRLETSPLPVQDLAAYLAPSAGDRLFVALDQVTDPRNFGAILRSCAVFGVAGVITTRHHTPPRDGILAKTASGAADVVPVIEVANLARALAQLAAAGVALIGLDERGETLIGAAPRSGDRVCVMGAEGKGLRRLTRESCTHLCRLPSAVPAQDPAARPEFATLNVSTATAVTLYALTQPKP